MLLPALLPGVKNCVLMKETATRRATGQYVLAELRRQVDRGDGTPGADRRCGGAKIVGARRDRNARRGRQSLHEQPRGRGIVHVDDDDIESAHYGGTEREAEQHEGDHRNAKQQEPRHLIAQDPAHFTRGDRKQARVCVGVTSVRSCQSV